MIGGVRPSTASTATSAPDGRRQCTAPHLDRGASLLPCLGSDDTEDWPEASAPDQIDRGVRQHQHDQVGSASASAISYPRMPAPPPRPRRSAPRTTSRFATRSQRPALAASARQPAAGLSSSSSTGRFSGETHAVDRPFTDPMTPRTNFADLNCASSLEPRSCSWPRARPPAAAGAARAMRSSPATCGELGHHDVAVPPSMTWSACTGRARPLLRRRDQRHQPALVERVLAWRIDRPLTAPAPACGDRSTNRPLVHERYE